ncbi:MAG: hypothetical protein ACYC3Q_05190 [Gemmatimonadaceae bacterium]
MHRRLSAVAGAIACAAQLTGCDGTFAGGRGGGSGQWSMPTRSWRRSRSSTRTRRRGGGEHRDAHHESAAGDAGFRQEMQRSSDHWSALAYDAAMLIGRAATY